MSWSRVLRYAAAPIVAWSDADNFPEIMDAMALIGETYGIRDFCN